MSPFVWQIEDDYYERQARFCLTTGVQPSEYDRMNGRQIEQFVKVQEAINKKAK